MGKIILDSDFVIALWLKDQSTHKLAKSKSHLFNQNQVYLLDITSYELVTLISKKFSLELLADFKALIASEKVSVIDSRNFEEEIWEEFWSHPKKGISFVDCANKVIAQRWKCKIASFDDFYPEDLKI